MSIKITKWFGRFGNNIIQISSALSKCVEKNCNLVLPYNNNLFWPHIQKIEITKNESNYQEEGLFWDYYLKDGDRRNICLKYLNNLLDLNEFELTNDDLVIHVRGGDIFTDVIKNYVQAPLSYTKKIIENTKPKNIIVVYEDFLNPTVKFIYENYSNVILENDFKRGIQYILSAKNVCLTGVGTFARAIIMCSKKIETIHVPMFEKHIDFFMSECKSFKINPYIDFTLNNNYFFHADYFIDFEDLIIHKYPILDYLKYGEWIWNEKTYDKFTKLN